GPARGAAASPRRIPELAALSLTSMRSTKTAQGSAGEQLVFDLAQPAAPTFETFVEGRNGEAVAALEALAEGAHSNGVFLWGAPGAGKSHLLASVVARAGALGRHCGVLERDAQAVLEIAPPPAALFTADDLDRLEAPIAGRLFTVYNALAAS